MSASATIQKWNQTASSYVRYFEPTTLIMGRYMLNCLKLQFQGQPLRVIEAGAGAGGLAKELMELNGLSLDHLYVTDIAEGMLRQAERRLEGFDKVVTVELADATQFKYADNTFDRYVSNMVLHYADDPNGMVNECYRVLKPGGICGFTIWGRRESSPLFTIVPDVLDDLNLCKKDPTKRNGFCLGQDDESLRHKLFKEFSKCLVMHVPIAIECLDEEYFVELIIDGAASTKRQIETYPEPDQVRVRTEVAKRAKTLMEQGTPIAIDTIVIVAQK